MRLSVATFGKGYDFPGKIPATFLRLCRVNFATFTRKGE
nr:MAG TPA: hypothetical protein [Siphoviridae sp. ctuK76]